MFQNNHICVYLNGLHFFSLNILCDGNIFSFHYYMFTSVVIIYMYIGLHMGPNNLCYVTRQFLFFPYVTFYKTLASFSKDLIKGHV